MAEFPSLQKVHKTFAPKGLVVIGVSSDDAEAIRRVARQKGVTFSLAHDPNDTVAIKYQVESIPRTLFIDSKGIVRADVVGGMEFDEVRAELKKIGL